VGGTDILTYGRASGLFAGMSLSGASLSPDDDANERLYGKGTSARDIVLGGTAKIPVGGERLVSLLNSKIPKRSSK
jgi:lipid-binding SYLF domain-containing protein